MTATGIDRLLRPLSARSLVASILLGTHPPSLPGRALVAMADRFAISEGALRVALSRMVERGELTNTNGVYSLAGPLLERQERQDRSRHGAGPRPWDGTWEQAVIIITGRSSSDRTRLRRTLTGLGLGELREGVWMRPANLDPDRQPGARAQLADQVALFHLTPMEPALASETIERLFDLDGWAATAIELADAIGQSRELIDTDDDAVVSGFRLASATLRHLAHDPHLPTELAPYWWPADDLRKAYHDYEVAYQQLLRPFLRSS
jgi:phenylacetic acid degradation operon negative regulatory protein